ncbi:hypothetical protein [Marinomonas spartinae]|uniref:hypothetical protein n=1 Tax=Marinomonas spartinae TaxID=1792290 RepID=UPI0018F19243|nr:hypothetical protein [Marinomonas spartinae]MBJ7556612.1 hypothetical protein [Marinomonas spartinae]
MYEQVEKPKEKSRAVANSVSQKKSDGKQGFVDNRQEAVAQRKFQELANTPTSQQRITNDIDKINGIMQRKINIVNPNMNIDWHIAYFDYIYPRLAEIRLETGATDLTINNLLKKYDQDNITFAAPEKLLEVLKQELIIEGLEGEEEPVDESGYEADIEDNLDSDQDLAKTKNESKVTKEALTDSAQIFGKPISIEESDNYFTLYRSVETGELDALKTMIKEYGIPIFTFKPGKEGDAEKMFAPNKSYVVESMGNKGKRSNLMEIIVNRKGLEDMIYNPKFTTAQGDANDWLKKQHNIGKETGGKPSPITLKRESPKKKKGISYTSINIGFRKSGNALELLAKNIVSIRLIEKKYDIKKEKDIVKSI